MENKRKNQTFLWDVVHPEHETVRVEAPDRLHAIVEAAHAWEIMKWTSVARECGVALLGPVRAGKKRSGRKKT